MSLLGVVVSCQVNISFLLLHRKLMSLNYGNISGKKIKGYEKFFDKNQIYNLLIVKLTIISIFQSLFLLIRLWLRIYVRFCTLLFLFFFLVNLEKSSRPEKWLLQCFPYS